MSKILQLTAENVKRLSVVEITPKGNVVVIGGKNGAGKSSVLDSIEYALAGDPKAKMPVRRGEEKARVVVAIDDLVVRRTFTATGGTTLVVTNKDGVKQLSPQTILDKLVGHLTFDPLTFSREKPQQQADTLRRIVGLDTTKDDQEREKLYDERTDVSREAKQLQARFTAMAEHKDAPQAEQSAAAILELQRKAAETNRLNELKRGDARAAKAAVENERGRIKAIEDKILELERQLGVAKESLKAAHSVAKKAEDEYNATRDVAAKLVDEDLSPFATQLQSVETANRKFRENKSRAEVVEQFKAKSAQAEKLTEKIDALDSKKRRATMDAKYPIAGLSFSDTGYVLFNGIPFEQTSGADQLKVSVAIGLALNPKLKILLIRDGSLLDEDSMVALRDMAEKAEAQIWLEVVSPNDPTAVIIEDGHVAHNESLV